MDVSICIPTRNGGEQFRQVLEAVFHQQTELTYEVICVDSGSTDGTLEIIRSYPQILLKQIAPEEFGHGRTRNLAASLGTGEFIVFLTQDAVPGHAFWLEQLVGAMRKDEKIVLAFGIHYPYPDCNVLDRRDIAGHFRNFGTENTVYRLEDPERYRTDEGYRHLLAFSSDNNACVRRSVFEEHPYPDVNFAEDQIWTRQMMEAGHSKIYCPQAPVYHSHNYDPSELLYRAYDEHKGLRELHGYRMVTRKEDIPGAVRRAVAADVRYIRAQPMTYAEKFRWCRYAVRRETARHRGGYLGGVWQDRSAEEQERMDRKYSQQRRQQRGASAAAPGRVWTREELWERTAAMAPGAAQDALIHPEEAFAFACDRREFPLREAERQAAEGGPRTVHWVIPEPREGSGGHGTIFRFVSALQKRGLKNRIYVLDAREHLTDREMRKYLLEKFPVLSPEAEIHASCEDMPFCHALVATGWTTAYFVRRFHNTLAKFYFIQDFEPMFYPVGTEYILAENTYRFGFRGITAGDWLRNKMERDYGMSCDAFRFSYDKDVFRPAEKRDSRPRVFFYARPTTPRRAVELGLLALSELKRKVPEAEIVLAGGEMRGYAIPFECRQEGTVSLKRLAALYSQSDLCLVMSLTNLSLMPLEVMASGSVAATQAGENNEWMITPENALIVDTDPVNIAETMAKALKDPERLAELRRSGLAFAQATDWNAEAEKVYEALTKGIGKGSASK